ncbi:hypothetical protein DMC25_09050 [Caulobacter sp. D4A]|uniref:hypothetical protein n=1 Tax=unclassified Caulobacter TaxID=2648921 RepID=UPI000D73F310|nr:MULTISPECIES: hypothetical protein [unclassified Caulobacter]PXA85856.1 hypothetical protein DMC18_22605 [Caulobacter sp. D5]PXA89721.1 hypothetical protein DMC25_09050 [Caulobacter sp. D4A]
MSSYADDLLAAALRLLGRKSGQRGKLAGARVRRSISTTYYALFHFLLEEVGLRIVGSHNDLRRRRRILARTISHKGLATTLDKVRGLSVNASIEEFFLLSNAAPPVASPPFVRELAKAFLDAQAKRHDADYDMNKPLSETDARLLRSRVRSAIKGWRAARSASDKDFKNALCVLILLRGQLRSES